MNPLCFSWVFILLLLPTTFHGVHGAADPNLISNVCKKSVADHHGQLKYDFCISSLKADPKSNTYDIFDLGYLSLNNTLKKGISIKSYIQHLLKDGKQSPDVMVRLKECAGRDYWHVDITMEGGIEAFLSADYPTAGIYVDVVSSYKKTCQSRFDGGIISPLTKIENEFGQLISIAFTLTDMNTPIDD
ncbi:putative invertase inhibitor [Papaver somniferum]|uniref:putative invertase inhibitor n=1 Tax=Papaver somniferum TaxID=3469 RepID=UPI000E6F5A35|nr:putative invertase inhibitor [Papaver somniferum]